MIIDGRDYQFAYTVGSYLDIAELKFGIPKTKAESNRLYIYTAVAMNKAFEDRLKLNNPNYVPQYLTLQAVRALKISDLPRLRAEVDEAYKRDGQIEVETQPKKGTKEKN